MTFKNISKTKLSLALISIFITFFVWQQGLRDSLSRPSVSFDISQKEQEIVELAEQSIPRNIKKFFILNDPVDEINNALSQVSFNELTERNKLIRIISSDIDGTLIENNTSQYFINTKYNLIFDELKKKSNNNSYKSNFNKFDLYKDDKFLYHLLSEEFDFDDSSLITKSFSSKMFLRILAIRLIPLLTIFLGSILSLKILWKAISIRKFEWKEIEPLNLDLLDMVLLIAGGFVVLGEVVSPLFSISLVELFSKNFSNELSQSLKIFFGYLFMAIPPLLIVFYQIKSLKGEFNLKKDYFQFKFSTIQDAVFNGIKGWLTIVPFVLFISLIMNSLIDNQNGSNPLLEIVLNTKSYFSFIILFVTTTVLAPLFEEIIFRGVLLPTLSRDFGIIWSIIVSSFVFALAHLSVGELPPLFVLGIGLGITRMASGSLLSSVIMHSLWNGLTFLNLFLLRT
jgi:hypothetical protein